MPLKRKLAIKRKRKQAEDTSPPTKRRPSATYLTQTTLKSKNLTWFLKIYKGLEDWHLPIFRDTRSFTRASHVLYPGSDKHLTASLVFPSVIYVDYNKNVEPVFHDSAVTQWINDNKDYDKNTDVTFLCKRFEGRLADDESFDLLISASAGIVSTPCSRYLKVGGYFLASDAHFDARTLFLDPKFELVGVFDKDTGKLGTDAESLAGHFETTSGKIITKKQVKESIQKSKSRRSFKLKKETWFYLFQKK